MRSSGLNILLIVLALFSAVATFGQQEYGQLNGVVKDQNGASIAGATVKVVNNNTNVAKTATTNADGFYLVTGLLPGSYSITTSAKGFSDGTTKTDVNAGGTNTLNIQLGVAAIVNVVDVAGTGGIAEINSTDQVQSTIINQRQISSLPVLDRDPYSLVQLAGNVAPPSDTQLRGANGVNINGQRSSSTNILLDGTENSATFTAGVAQTVPQDSVEEFRVITGNFSAEYGRASGGIVNVVTKPGGNRFDFSAFEQNRNSALTSNLFSNKANGIKKGIFNRNQFGYSALGPIKKDKLFFSNFGEWTRVRSYDTTRVWIPSASCVNGMAANAKTFFTTYGQISPSAHATGRTQVVAGTTAVNGVVPSCRFDQYAYTAPIDAGGGLPQNTWNNVARVDWTVNSSTSAYFTYKIENDGYLQGTRFTSPYDGYNTNLVGRNQNVQGSVVHNFSSNLIFDAKLAFRRLQNTPTFDTKDPNTPTLYVSNGTVLLNGDFVAFPGYIPYNPGFGYDSAEDERLWDFKPNLTWIRGNHNIRFGGQYIHLQDATQFGAFQNASENLAGNLAGAVQALMTTGQTAQFQVAVDPQGKFPGGTVTLPVKAPNFLRTNVYNEFAIYANDQWKVSRTLTLNLGLRYEYYGPQKSKEGLDANFYFGSGNLFQSIRTGSVQIASSQGGLWKADKNNWAPRVGFAWDVFGSGRTSIRGGYGIAFERNFGNVTFNVIQNPPFYAVLGVGNVPISTSNFGPLAGSTGTAVLPAVTLRAVDPNIQNAFAHQWGVSLEQQLRRNTVIKFDYSGTAGRHLYSIANINRRGSGTTYLGSPATGCAPGGNADRLNCVYGNINFRGSDGTSNYNGLTSSIESTDLFGTGLVLTARYTYAVAKDNLSSTFSDGQITNFGLGYLDPFNPMMDYGYADFDIRHRLVASWVYPITKKFNNRYANDAFGGWNFSGIFTAYTGAPFTIFDCTNARTVCARMLGGSPLTFNGKSSIVGPDNYNYIDLSHVTPIAPTDPTGTNETGPWPGNMTGRNTFRSPGFWNFDASLFKNISVTERYRLQLRVDAFNVLNHANFFVNGATADVANVVGVGNQAIPMVNAFFEGRRTVQVSAKIFF